MVRHQSRKGGQMGQQALAQGDPEGLVNENLRGPASNVLSGEEGGRGGCWMKTWETLLYCPGRTATVLPKFGGGGEEDRREAERPGGQGR